MQENKDLKDALESVPCEVYSIDHLKEHAEVQVLTRDNVHTWARDNGGPIEITDDMVGAGVKAYLAHDPDAYVDNRSEVVRYIYAAMEAKRCEGK